MKGVIKRTSLYLVILSVAIYTKITDIPSFIINHPGIITFVLYASFAAYCICDGSKDDKG